MSTIYMEGTDVFTAEAVPCQTEPAFTGYNPAQAGFGL